jgi:hypothetical protein
MEIDIGQLEFIDRDLRKMLVSAEQQFADVLPFVVTSLYRIGDNGVHGQLPLRGIDIRCHDDTIADAIVIWVNTRYQYDPNRPQMACCMYHDVGLGKHLHFQVHPNTVKVIA